ncbi:MAG TPA: nucleoside hydrolase [Firmicutes bacterium]|nr:nucleoside hydrolase [Bacillota bacterium]
MKKVLLDCDPGHDDMMAIMLALYSEELDVLGITTVAGNQTGEKTFLNALKTLTLIGEKNVVVARGFDKPLFRDLVVAPKIHGVSGLDGADLPEPEVEPSNMHAVDFIIETAMNSNESVYLIPTGPLTNVAVALLKEPKIKRKIERIVLMGGAVFDSNITPASEFNIFVDPEAARIVFESGVNITMVGLDVTNKALLSFDDIEEIGKMNGRVSRVISPLLKFFASTNKEVFGINGAPLHDALAVSYVIDPSILKTEYLHVDIETRGEFTRGETVVDVYRVTGKDPNADVAFEVDVKKFKNLIFDMIRYFDQKLKNQG